MVGYWALMKKLGIKRDLFVKALNEEGFPCYGDMLTLYLCQLFKEGRHLEEKLPI